MLVTTGLFVALVLALTPLQGIEVVQPTQGELFASRLRLDGKTQAPIVQQVLSAAQKEAEPVTAQMLQLREQMLNFALAGKTAELKAAGDQYAAAAAAMAGIEAKAFARIHETLRDNQKPRAAESFAILGGVFLPPAHLISMAPGGGRGRGGN
jgi:hypothetical protein